MIERLPRPVADPLAPPGERAGVRAGVRVLLVEDDPRDAELVIDLLDDGVPGNAPSLTWVRRLSEARTALTESPASPPDVVLLDLSLPDATGLMAVETLCAEHPDIPIVVTTGLADDALAARAVHAGAQDYLVKGAEGVQGIRRAIRYAIERQVVARERAELLRREHEARVAAEEAERRARFLASASAALATSLDYRTTLAAVTQLAVPTVAECAVTFVARDDQTLEPVEVAQTPTDAVTALRARVAALAADEEAMPLLRLAFRSGRTMHGTIAGSPFDAGEPAGERAGDGEHTAVAPEAPGHLLRAVGAHAYLLVPMRLRERSHGVLALAMCSPERSFGPADVQLAEALADRAAAAVEHARLYAEARRAVEVRDEVLGIVSHDLRNPLSAIAMAAHGLRASHDPEMAQFGEIVGRSATWALRTIRDLLDVTAIEAGRLPVHPEPMTVTAILEQTAAMLTPLAQERGIALTFAKAPTARWVEADVDRLVQALGNLVGNALKFTPRGGRVAVSAESDGATVRFRVTDTGPGIPPEALPRLFDRFWQAQEARRTRREGVGLGLAIVKGIAEGHGGHVEVESTVGAGSTFTLVLPAGRPSRP